MSRWLVLFQITLGAYLLLNLHIYTSFLSILRKAKFWWLFLGVPVVKTTMGKSKKVVSQAEPEKATRNNVHEKKKKDLSNWIKILRPKVYITDSSSFKRLVQDLTGNGTPSTITSKTQERSRIEKVPIIDNYDDQGEPESSMEASIGATTADSSEFYNQVSLNQDFNQVCNEIVGFEDFINLGNSEADQQVTDLVAYSDIEPWLLESTEPCTSGFNYGCGQVEQDVSIYDYELSGFL